VKPLDKVPHLKTWRAFDVGWTGAADAAAEAALQGGKGKNLAHASDQSYSHALAC